MAHENSQCSHCLKVGGYLAPGLCTFCGKGWLSVAHEQLGFTLGPVDTRPTTWQLNDGNGGFLVRVSLRDGTLEYGPEYSQDAVIQALLVTVARIAVRV